MYERFLEIYNYFKDNGLDDPLTEALRLYDLLSNGALSNAESSLENSGDVDLQEIVQKRKDGVPLEYIIGKVVFMGLTLNCLPDALIPRVETELLVSTSIDIIRDRNISGNGATLVEVGTGSGNIAVALAMNTENVRILASDICGKAVEVARSNVDLYGLGNRVTLRCGDLFEPFIGPDFAGKVDIVVCNPPYIPTKSLEKLDPEIIDHEPVLALDAGAYGIDFFRKLINGAVHLLKPGGILVFEIGAGQEKLVNRLFDKIDDYEDIEHIDDGKEIRVISAVKRS